MSNYEIKQPDINIVANLDLDSTNANKHIANRFLQKTLFIKIPPKYMKL